MNKEKENRHRLHLMLCLALTASLFFLPSAAASYPSFNILYLYGEDRDRTLSRLRAIQPYIHTVAPDFFSIDENGNVQPSIDRGLIDEIHRLGGKVTPYVSNHWNREAGSNALKNREQLVKTLTNAVITYGLDGINVDIENIPKEQRNDLTAFVRMLAERLHPLNKTVAVAVPPAQEESVSHAYDYEALGNIADTIYLMAYDQSYPGSPPGPVASIDWVERSLRYVTKKIPSRKLVLGLPFYGRYWTDTVRGKGLTYGQIMNMISKHQAGTAWDESSQTPYARFKDERGSDTHIWFENSRSLQEKLKLVRVYNLKGWGAWRLGQEDPEFWKKLQSVYDTVPFSDIGAHWALSDIMTIWNDRLLTGYPDDTFRPDQPISRDETAALIQRIMKLEDRKTAAFQDVPPSEWSYGAIGAVSTYGLMNGYPDGEFKPNQPLTRAELAVIIRRCFDLKKQGEASFFPDVNHHWAEEAIIALQEAGVLEGYPDGLFHPERPVTRAEMSAILSRIVHP